MIMGHLYCTGADTPFDALMQAAEYLPGSTLLLTIGGEIVVLDQGRILGRLTRHNGHWTFTNLFGESQETS